MNINQINRLEEVKEELKGEQQLTDRYDTMQGGQGGQGMQIAE